MRSLGSSLSNAWDARINSVLHSALDGHGENGMRISDDLNDERHRKQMLANMRRLNAESRRILADYFDRQPPSAGAHPPVRPVEPIARPRERRARRRPASGNTRAGPDADPDLARLGHLLRDTDLGADLRTILLRRYPREPWRANFLDVDWQFADQLDAEAGLRAMALAPTIPVYTALMRGEQVPIEALDQEAVKRYGLRRTTT
jgi:hypothetical protein